MAAEALEQSALEGKDKDQLLQIAKALGVRGISKLKKADLVGAIIDATGGDDAPAPSTNGSKPADTAQNGTSVSAATDSAASATDTGTAEASKDDAAENEGSKNDSAAADTKSGDDGVVLGPDGEPLADWEIELQKQGVSTDTTDADTDSKSGDSKDDAGGRDENGRRNRNSQQNDQRSGGDRDGQRDGGRDGQNRNRNSGGGQNDGGQKQGGNQGGNNQGGGNQGNNQGGGNRNSNNNRNDDGGGNNKRRRRRRKGGNRGQEGPQGDDVELLDDDGQPQSNEPIEVSGYLDMRDEGYGFLRINGYLPSKQDAYIPVKLARQYGLRKGDQLTGKMRPPQRNEKNPALLEVHTVNGGDPEKAKKRPRFENLTALFPDEKLQLEDPSDPTNMTARIIDLISPIGKGQRGILVSPPKAGKTTIMKTIAKMVEKNNPDVELIMLLVDERPEEVTDIKRTVKGEVISSTFDRPSDEHTAIAEMTIAKAKRMVEDGKDVVIMLDGITRLSRAYNLAAPASGRILSGGIDAGALYPPKKFFGAARNVEEGGSLTILATALVDTNSRMDDAIFEEFKGTGNMELRLDRKVAERRIYPAIDVDASSTRHEELLFDRKELQMVWKLRRVLSGLAADGNAAPGLELLMDRLKTFKSNSEFLSEIAKQPGM
ncbi:transcription termination factor Rho [Ilumatobacter nonamiensis]|uniref:transcription termination factor Rho n=1 Tax=Ilumatobacter nonamiensis TaxID=467093 RepID=UPI00068716E6|nr:transcription termination factor Rho [Ilumatobacter nonamiensis]